MGLRSALILAIWQHGKQERTKAREKEVEKESA
jgi:hypothetical protein